MKDWEELLRESYHTLDDLFSEYPQAKNGYTDEEITRLKEITQEFPFRVTKYYAGLIDWNNPKDPLRNLIFPCLNEGDITGSLDSIGEEDHTIMGGLQHKFDNEALILVNSICGGYCRHCFRKRFVGTSNKEVAKEINRIEMYLKTHPDIETVILSGGDPLTLGNERLAAYINKISRIQHIRTIRVDTRITAYLPQRVDAGLIKMLKESASFLQGGLYILHSFYHPRELTPEAINAFYAFSSAGITQLNQAALLKGINDNPETLKELCNMTSHYGVLPYYLFQCKPVKGSTQLQVPLVDGYRIVEEAKKGMNGLAKKVRYVISNTQSKIEVIGLSKGRLVLQHHQSSNKEIVGNIFYVSAQKNLYWIN